MKTKFISTVSGVFILLATTAFMTQSDNGIQGFAGSPGEGTCSNCHGGGSSASSEITVNALPAFSVNENGDLEFMPDSVYQIQVDMNASGYTHFGFAAQILNSSVVNSGTLQAAGSGVKFLNAGAKRSAVHTTPKFGSNNAVSFTFQWKAPSQGDATIYAIGNAVNNNGSTSGDFVISPVSVPLVAAPVPVDTTIATGIFTQGTHQVERVSLYPNPCSNRCYLNYQSKAAGLIKLELIDGTGKVVYVKQPGFVGQGFHQEELEISGLNPGLYTLRISGDGSRLSKQLLIVR